MSLFLFIFASLVFFCLFVFLISFFRFLAFVIFHIGNVFLPYESGFYGIICAVIIRSIVFAFFFFFFFFFFFGLIFKQFQS